MSDSEMGDTDQTHADELARIDSELAAVKKQLKALEARQRALERQRTELLERQQQAEADRLQTQDWGRRTGFPWSQQLDAALTGVFRLHNYRPDQLAVINATLSGHDALLIMPTGGGKSLTYQLPAVISSGVTLVVSPLLSLMEDQLMALQRLNVNAAMLNSHTSKDEKNRVMKEMLEKKSDLRLLYVTPEKCSKSKQFMTKLQKMYQMGRLDRIAIDEVHCCSQWGHDFRPDYKFLGAMKNMFPDVPILGLTATSTAHVTKDVKEILRIPKAMVFLSGFNRPNLHYSVKLKPDSAVENVDQLAALLQTDFKGQSGIIYTTTIKEVETLTDELRRRGLKVGSYHAQMEPPSRRSQVHRAWMAGEIQVVVATVAFGMGIDKPDVRFVIHNTISKSMENFYQESGRAGRDDQPARCILQFRLSDVFKQSTMVFTEQTGQEKLYSMVAYCLNRETCRRNIIAEHFLETWEPVPCNQMCDNCDGSGGSARPTDITKYAEAAVKILNQARARETRLTGLKLVEALMGKGTANLKLTGWQGGLSKEDVEMVVCHLIIEGYLKEDFHFTPYSTISYLLPGRREVKTITCNLWSKLATVKTSRQSSSRGQPGAAQKKKVAKRKRIVSESCESDEDFVPSPAAAAAVVATSSKRQTTVLDSSPEILITDSD